jgi:hypothetical protein
LGIFYFKFGERKGDKYVGENKEWNFEGKGIYYYHNGDRYEGDFKDNKREGKGIYYYRNGDREMGDYNNDKKIGKHVLLSIKGQISHKKY